MPRPEYAWSGYDEEMLLLRIRNAPIVWVRPTGHTSLAFKLTLAGGIDAAYKPNSRMLGDAYRAEIAAYRLARALKVGAVPPAISRRVTRQELIDHLDPEFASVASRIDEEGVFDREEDRGVRGAAMYWIPTLRPSGIDTLDGIATWSRWLRHDGQIPGESRALAAQVSTLLVFDYLIGNWDRFSGGNCYADETGKRLLFLDNNSAFMAPMPEHFKQRTLGRLERAERFEARFIERLRRLDLESIRRELAKDPDPAHPALDGAQIAGVLARREEVLSYVDALTDAYGQSAVLAFP